MKELERIKKIFINNSDDYEIHTINKETKQQGVATFYLKEDIIKVFEGASDGSDDKEYTYQEFLDKYDFKLIKGE